MQAPSDLTGSAKEVKSFGELSIVAAHLINRSSAVEKKVEKLEVLRCLL
jgi:hypothetical protein